MNNLAQDPAFAQTQDRLSQELDRWMLSQGDPGAEQDTRMSIRAARQGKHRFIPPSPPTAEQ